MDYPDNFETPAFPAGRRIAISRLMAVWILIAALLVVFLSLILIWSSRSDKLVPFLISTNPDTGEWVITGRASRALEYTAARTMQESVAGNFVRDWFAISANSSENDGAWRKCERDECAGDTSPRNDAGARDCAIFCAAGDELFTRFTYDILPGYTRRAQSGETWALGGDSLILTPVGQVSDEGGTWQITADIYSSAVGAMAVKAFIKIAKNLRYYPQTMGFYVSDFNAYRIN